MKKRWIRSSALVLALTLSVQLFSGIGMKTAKASIDTGGLRDAASRAPRWTIFKNWMSDAWSEIKDKPYNQISVLGTHDSGTYGVRLSAATQISSQIHDAMFGIMCSPLAPIAWPVVREFNLNKSMLQDTNVYNQLSEGARMLDLRFKRYTGDPFVSGDNELRAFHGGFGDTEDQIINQVKDYLDNSDSREIIYVELNINGEMFDITKADENEIGTKFKNVLGKYMFTPSEFSSNKTMAELAATGKRLIVTAAPNVDDTLHATRRNFVMTEVNRGNQDIINTVLPGVKTDYEAIKNDKGVVKSNNTYTDATYSYDRANMLQLKIIASWNVDTDLAAIKTAGDRWLSTGNPSDFGKIFTAIGNLPAERLDDLTEQYKTNINQTLNGLATGDNDWTPTIWLTDMSSEEQYAEVIKRNFGHNLEQQKQKLNSMFNNATSNENVSKSYFLLKNILTMEGLATKDVVPAGEFYVIPGANNDSERLTKKTGFEWNLTYNKITQTPKSIYLVSNGENGEGNVTKIMLTYNDQGESASYGSSWGAGWHNNYLTLNNGEYINRVKVQTSGSTVNFMAVFTNQGRVIKAGRQYGIKDSTHYEYVAPAGTAISGFYGYSDNEKINSVMPIYKSVGDYSLTGGDLKYKNVIFKNINSGKDLDATTSDYGTKNYIQMQQWGNWNGDSQIWQVIPTDDGYYYFFNKRSGFALDGNASNNRNGGALIQYEFNGCDWQKWSIEPAYNGSYAIKNKASGRVVDVINFSMSDGTGLQMYDRVDNVNQLWKLVDADNNNEIKLTTTATQRTIRFKNINSNLYLDSSTSDYGGKVGIQIQQWGDWNGPSQNWRVIPAEDGYVYLLNVRSGYALDANASNSGNGGALIQYTFNGSDWQKWKITSGGLGYVLQNKASGRVADVAGWATNQGAGIQMYDRVDNGNQLWTVTYSDTNEVLNSKAEVSYKLAIFTNVNSNLDLDSTTSDYGTKNAVQVQQWGNWNAPSQTWKVIPAGDGYYYLVNQRSGYALDANGSDNRNGAALLQYSFNYSDWQKWAFVPVNGGYVLKNKASGRVADVPGGNKNQGCGIIIYDQNNYNNQIWNITYLN